MRSLTVLAAFSATGVVAQSKPQSPPAAIIPVLLPAASAGSSHPPPKPVIIAETATIIVDVPPKATVAPAPPPPPAKPAAQRPPPPAKPAAQNPPPVTPWQGLPKNAGPGVMPPKGVTLPNLSATAKSFKPGVDANSPKLASQLPPGKYAVGLIQDKAFPNRTLYVPQSVPAGVKVPIFAWENGICYKYGRMYQGFLQEIASHGYLIVVPGPPNELVKGMTNADWQLDSIAMARGWASAPFTINREKVAIGGHSCGGGETIRNLARVDAGQVTTGIIMNSAGSSETFDDVNVPMLWVHGGQTDTEDRAEANFDYVVENRPELPVALVGLQTGHLGSYWWPRGGIYAETVVHWLNGQLKDEAKEKAWFIGGNSSAAATRGWTVETSNIGE
jgi:hypothetical protein